MKHDRKTSELSRRKSQRVVGVEALEERTMLTAAETFTGPSLADLISFARQGTDTAPAGINRMLQSLETQLTDGPLSDLSSAAVDGNGFVQEVQSLESSYEQNVVQQLSPNSPRRRDTQASRPGDRGRRDCAESAKHRRSDLELRSDHGRSDRDRLCDRRPNSLARHAAFRLFHGDAIVRG